MLTRLLILLAILLLPVQGWGAIGVGNRAGETTCSDPFTSASFTVTESSPLIVSISWSDNVTIASVNWNTSEALTAINSRVGDTAGGRYTQVFGIKNPTATTATIAVDFSGAIGSCAFVAIIGTTGGDTTTGWRTPSTQSGDATAGPGLTLGSYSSGDLVFHAATVLASTIQFATGETSTSTEGDDIAGSAFSGGMSTGTSSTVDAGSGGTPPPVDVTYYSEVAVAVIPASGGGGGGATPRNLMLMGVGP